MFKAAAAGGGSSVNHRRREACLPHKPNEEEHAEQNETKQSRLGETLILKYCTKYYHDWLLSPAFFLLSGFRFSNTFSTVIIERKFKKTQQK